MSSRNSRTAFASLFTFITFVTSASAMSMSAEAGSTMQAKDDVTSLQTFLIDKGLLSLPAGSTKGTFGPRTRAALKKYQMSAGLPATGFFGPKTKMHLKEMMGEGAMMKKDAMMMHGAYVSFSADAFTAAKKEGTAVLFFHAGWCPFCKQSDAAINASLAKIPKGVTILKVDYDTATALKQQYGVTVQNTFVKVGTNGDTVKTFTGSATFADMLANF